MSKRRIAKRILFGFLAFVFVAIAGAVIFVHTDYGRGVVRDQVEGRLNTMFVGGATIGKIEGSPFGELTLRDVVINGPDHKPVITIERLGLELAILPLLSQQARLSGLVAEGVVVDLRRDENGELVVKNMMQPSPKSTWSLDIPDIVITRARVAYDTGSEVMHLDSLELSGSLKMSHEEPLDATLVVHGTWRERQAAVDLDIALHKDSAQIAMPRLVARAGDVTLEGTHVQILLAEKSPLFGGSIVVAAPRGAVARLVPELDLPGDLAIELTATPVPERSATHVELDATMGDDSMRASIDADLGDRKVSGMITASDLDIARLTRGRIAARGGGMVLFDLAQSDGLPVGTALVHAVGEYEDFPRTRVTVALESDGARVDAMIGATNRGLVASIDAQVHKVGDTVTLERGKLVATTGSPAAASGGKAPVHGTLHASLAASGALLPTPSLAVAGRIDGSRLRVADVKVAKLAFEIDVKRLPARPLGRFELEAEGVERGDMFLRELKVTAADRDDGRIAVTMRSRPKQDPWLFEADAIVTTGDVVTIDLTRHRVRAGSGADWTGNTGRVVITKHRVDVRDVKSAGRDGALALAGMFERRSGDFVAKLDAGEVKLATLKDGYAGTIEAHVDVERRAGKLAGTVKVGAKGISLDPKVAVVEGDATITARADQLTMVAKASGTKLGRAELTLDIDAPADITNADAWKRLGRSAIRTGRIALHDVDIEKIAQVAGVDRPITGRIDGDVLVSSTNTGGVVRVRDLMAPPLRSLGKVNVDLQIAQSGPNELTPSAVARVGDVGSVTAQAKLGIPDRLFDPAAWRSLGRGAVRYASVSAKNLAIDPALLDRFGLVTYARGKLSFTAEVSPGIADAKLSVALRTLRGSPISQPIDIDLLAVIDGTGTKSTLGVTTREHVRKGKEEIPTGPVVKLFDATATVPLTIGELEADPRRALNEPLLITAKLPNVPAKHVLAVFGRREVTGGTLEGTVDVGGTVANPTVRSHFVGHGLQVPPGPGGKPIKTVKRITLDASWDGKVGKLALDGIQEGGTLRVDAAGSPTALADVTVTVKAKKFDLLPILAFAPGPAGGAAGRLDADLTLRGLDPTTAKLAGNLHLENGRIPIAPDVGTLRRAKIDIVVKEHTLELSVEGRLGSGTVSGKGTLAMTGASPTGGEATLILRKVSPIGVVEPVVDANVDITLEKAVDKWIARIDVKNGVIVVPDARGEQLKPPGAPPDMVFMSGERITDRPMARKPPSQPMIVAYVRIRSMHIQSAEMRGLIKGNLTITSDGASVGIVGQIDADRGDLDLFGHRYAVERASVRFDGSTDPLIDLKITHDFPDVTTITEVRGRLSKPELVMGSNPGTYSQGQLLGFLLGGQPDGNPGDARDRATAAGASFVANKLGGYVKRALPIDLDVLRYEAASASSSAAITVGTWLTRDLFLAYRRRLEARPDENANEGDLEYWLSRRVLVEGIVGDRNRNGVDLLWRKRY